jgi:hypothetical protein
MPGRDSEGCYGGGDPGEHHRPLGQDAAAASLFTVDRRKTLFCGVTKKEFLKKTLTARPRQSVMG